MLETAIFMLETAIFKSTYRIFSSHFVSDEEVSRLQVFVNHQCNIQKPACLTNSVCFI